MVFSDYFGEVGEEIEKIERKCFEYFDKILVIMFSLRSILC